MFGYNVWVIPNNLQYVGSLTLLSRLSVYNIIWSDDRSMCGLYRVLLLFNLHRLKVSYDASISLLLCITLYNCVCMYTIVMYYSFAMYNSVSVMTVTGGGCEILYRFVKKQKLHIAIRFTMKIN